MRIAKRKSNEQLRIEALLARQERRIQRAFGAFLADARSETVLRQVREAIEAGDMDAAMSFVDSHVVQLGDTIPRAFLDAADEEMRALSQQLGMDRARAAISFDPSDERAAELMRNARLDFIREFTRQQRDATRRALTDGLMEGMGPRGMTRNFRNSIGLTTRQWDAVQNYRRLLETGSLEALQRELRDRRFDPTVRRLFREGEALTRDQIDRMLERYRERYLQYRAETISRTESLRAVNEAREESFRQAADTAGITEDQVEVEWSAVGDERTRFSHWAMNGQRVRQGESFESPMGARLRYPGDPEAPPEETINCRCSVIRHIQTEAQRAAA